MHMENLLLGKCWYCGSEITYQDGASMVKCPVCGETLAVAEFLNEQIRIRKALEEGKRAAEDLKAAEAAKKEAEQKLQETVAEIGKTNDAHAQQEKLLEELRRKQEKSELDKIVRLYHQAENYQFERQFDKAAEYYHRAIVAGGNDPEVYWRIVLCHYCIEYQVDNEGNRIPSILYPDLTDPSEIPDRKDLEKSYQTEAQRKYYTELLGTIDRILNKYRELRTKVQFDVFISVKQRDEGKYTVDCGKAYELYQYIKDELGLRVFNSEHTRPPVGQEFEPYILSALLSSKVMIVVGSKKEYMEAQWVRNEWSRFQWLQKYENKNEGGSERLLFGYLVQGMQAGNMPRALANIQAIQEGVNAKDQLKNALMKVFSDKTTISSPEPIEKVLSDWSYWLGLGKFDRIRSEYDKLVDQGRYMEHMKVHLYALCADYKLTDINQLPDGVLGLTNNNKFNLACRNAHTDEEKELLEELKRKYREGQERRKKKNMRCMTYSVLLSSAVALVLLLLFIVKPIEDAGRDIGLEAILIGGTVILFVLSILYIRSLIRINTSGRAEIGIGTRVVGFIQLILCGFALWGAFREERDIWIIGRWKYWLNNGYSVNIPLIEIYCLIGAIALAALCAILMILSRGRRDE